MFKKVCEVVRKFPFVSWCLLTCLVGAVFLMIVYVFAGFKSDSVTIAVLFLATIVAALIGTAMTHYAETQKYMKKHPEVNFKEAWEKTRPSK